MKTNVTDARTANETGNYDNAIGLVVFTDTFLSGWGGAEKGRSLYALEVCTEAERDIVWANGMARSEMKRPKFYPHKFAVEKKMGAGDHLKIVDKRCAARWYEAGAFRNDK